jgi:hypothetical protein
VYVAEVVGLLGGLHLHCCCRTASPGQSCSSSQSCHQSNCQPFALNFLNDCSIGNCSVQSNHCRTND